VKETEGVGVVVVLLLLLVVVVVVDTTFEPLTSPL
jgi:Na+-transporting methylmalonyl-CoA/oxaloacetate decarboxylase gamma subunit